LFSISRFLDLGLTRESSKGGRRGRPTGTRQSELRAFFFPGRGASLCPPARSWNSPPRLIRYLLAAPRKRIERVPPARPGQKRVFADRNPPHSGPGASRKSFQMAVTLFTKTVLQLRCQAFCPRSRWPGKRRGCVAGPHPPLIPTTPSPGTDRRLTQPYGRFPTGVFARFLRSSFGRLVSRRVRLPTLCLPPRTIVRPRTTGLSNEGTILSGLHHISALAARDSIPPETVEPVAGSRAVHHWARASNVTANPRPGPSSTSLQRRMSASNFPRRPTPPKRSRPAAPASHRAQHLGVSTS